MSAWRMKPHTHMALRGGGSIITFIINNRAYILSYDNIIPDGKLSSLHMITCEHMMVNVLARGYIITFLIKNGHACGCLIK